MDLSPTQLHAAPEPAILLPAAHIDIDLRDGEIVVPSTRAATVVVVGSPSPATIMKRNLTHIFCEHDADARARVFDELWHKNAVIYGPDNARAGQSAVLEIAARFGERMDGLTCSLASPVSGSNDLHMLRWFAHRGGSTVATGCHIGVLVRHRIHAFYMIED